MRIEINDTETVLHLGTGVLIKRQQRLLQLLILETELDLLWRQPSE